jgi:1,4-alpha-glucan branching enzyme
MTLLTPEAYAVIEGRHSDPFRYLGPHVENGSSVVRVFLPDAEGVAVIDEQGHESDLQRIHDAGLFEGRLRNGSQHYRLRARYGGRQVEIEDPYRFPPILSDLDLYLLGEGTHMHPYDKLGAHPMVLDGVEGVGFAVFAPSAKRVSVVGDFNLWDGRRHAMRVRGNGFWEIFVPEAKPGNWLAGKDRASEVTMNDLTAELRLRGLEPPYDVVKQELAISQGAAADGLAVTGGRQRRRRFKARPYSC